MSDITEPIKPTISEETHYIFEGNNAYRKSRFTYEEAERLSKTLVNCQNCVDCIYCIECKYSNNCKDSRNCEYCYDCSKCIDCYDCLACKNCESCFNGGFGKDCKSCREFWRCEN
ncbi:hypothetical protein, partial [Campylobacter devanensis]|uniref:hypothetical protein n=1 Tax=Campylobacter devanensis TaxID=3161138 RepID=UPI000A357268